MSESLEDSHCESCEGGVQSFNDSQVEEYLRKLNSWNRIDENGVPKIRKEYSFEDFIQAVEFVHKVTEIAEAEGHHPVLEVSYGTVVVKLWTHAVDGLTKNDFRFKLVFIAWCQQIFIGFLNIRG